VIDLSRADLERSSLQAVCWLVGGGADFGRRLSRQLEPERVEQQAELGLRLGVAREHELTSVGGRDVHVDHLQGGEFLEHAARRQSWRQGVETSLESDVEAIGKKGDEDVRLDPFRILVEDRMSLSLKRRLTLDALARVTRIGRAEPQARRVSHEGS
jgi:hypothetical protein